MIPSGWISSFKVLRPNVVFSNVGRANRLSWGYLPSGGIERGSLVFFTQMPEFSLQGTENDLIFFCSMNALHFLWIFSQIIEIPVLALGKINQFVGVGADAKVLGNCVFAKFIIGVIK